MKSYGKLVGALLGAWFVFALTASAAHVFTNNFNRIGLAVAAAAVIPILLFGLWFGLSRDFRRFTLELNPQALTFAQSWRVLGAMFVVLQTYNILPAIFALPAGYGDIFIGITASLVAWKYANPANRTLFIAWQLLGMADLLTAVTLGTTAPFIQPHGIPTTPMTVLPLSLIPTFLVPLFLILHIICIAQAKGWKQSAEGAERNIKPAQSVYAQ